MTPAGWWVVAGLVGCALEMVAPGVFLLPIGAAAVVTGGATALGVAGPGQWAVFVAAVAVLIGGTIAVRGRHAAVPNRVNAPASGLVGTTCRALAFDAGEGRVSVGDGTWSARLYDRAGVAPRSGEALSIVGLDGTTLLVAPMSGSST